MADKRFTGVSSQGREELPESLRKQGSLREPFSKASDPFALIDQETAQRSEGQRQGPLEKGSHMVSQSKPFPELRPQNDNGVKRESFNARWDLEVERAQREQPKAQTQTRKMDAFDAIEKFNSDRRNQEHHSMRPPGKSVER